MVWHDSYVVCIFIYETSSFNWAVLKKAQHASKQPHASGLWRRGSVSSFLEAGPTNNTQRTSRLGNLPIFRCILINHLSALPRTGTNQFHLTLAAGSCKGASVTTSSR